jgi:hypothetical protein
MTSKFILFFSLLFSISSFGAIIRERSHLSGPQILGGNYNSKKDFFDTGLRCLEVDDERDIETIYNERANVVATSSIDYGSLLRELSYDLSIGAEMPMGDPVSMSLGFLRNSEETKTSLTFIYKTVLSAGTVILKGPYKLTPEAQQVANESGLEAFSNYCGDQFVTQLEKGAKAFVAVKVELGSEEKKRAVSNEIGITMLDFVDIASKLKKLNKQFNFSGEITISGYQEGGFAARINSIFGSGIGVAKCSGADFVKCEVLLKEVSSYFSREFAEQFDHYYRDSSGSGVITLPSSAKTLNYVTQSYCKLPPQDRPLNFNCNVVDVTPFLVPLNQERASIYKELQDILNIKTNSQIRLAEDYLSLLNNYEKDLQTNLIDIKKAELACNQDNSGCESTVRHCLNNLIPRNPKLFETVKQEGRLQICFNSGNMVDLNSLEFRLSEKGKTLKIFKLFDAPKYSTQDCYYFHTPELKNIPFDELELRIETMGEDKGECKIHREKKFSSWAEWQLESVSVTHMATGYNKTFDGYEFKKGKKCTKQLDAKQFLPWTKLTPRHE